MCNLYSITTNQAAMSALFRAINRYVGNLPPMPGVLPIFVTARRARDAEHAQRSIRRSRCFGAARTGAPENPDTRRASAAGCRHSG